MNDLESRLRAELSEIAGRVTVVESRDRRTARKYVVGGIALLVVALAVGVASLQRKATIHRTTLTVQEVVRATQNGGAVRIDGTATVTGQPPEVSQISGKAEFNPTRLQLDVTTALRGRKTTVANLFVGTSWYVQGDSGEPTGRWCLLGSTSAGFPNPLSAVQSLATQGWSARKVDAQRIRGVSTTHYRVTRPGRTPIDIWADSSSRLRRLLQSDNGEVDRFDFYDYDVRAPTITTPSASNCR